MSKIAVIALLLGNLYFGQQNQNQKIEKPIRNLFLGMKNADPELCVLLFPIRLFFRLLQRWSKNEEIKDFIASVSKVGKNDWMKDYY
jgi:hypothetical protein